MDTILRRRILTTLSLEGLTQEEADHVITTLGGLTLENLIHKVMTELSDEDVILFEEVIAGGDQVAIVQFLEKTVPHFEDLVAESADEVIKDYQELIAAA